VSDPGGMLTGMGCTDFDCDIEFPPTLTATSPLALFEELRGVVERCLAHGDCFFIVESEVVHRYVQGLVDDDGLVLESVSNTSLGNECATEHGLSAEDQRHLARLGWAPPDERNPNWFRHLDADAHHPAALAAEILVRTLLEVHRAEPPDLDLIVCHAAEPAERVPVGADPNR